MFFCNDAANLFIEGRLTPRLRSRATLKPANRLGTRKRPSSRRNPCGRGAPQRAFKKNSSTAQKDTRASRTPSREPRLLVAEADAQLAGLADEVALGVDVLQLAGDVGQGHAGHLAVDLGDQEAVVALHDCVAGDRAALGGEDAVLGVGRAAALGVAGDGDAGLAAGAGLDVACERVGDARIGALGEAGLVLLLGQRRLLLGDRALGDHDDREAAAVLLALLGVEEDQVYMDYEVSFFSDMGGYDDKTAPSFMVQQLDSLKSIVSPGKKKPLYDKARAYLLKLGLTDAELDAIRANLLEEIS